MDLTHLLEGFGGGWTYPVVAVFAVLESATFVGLVLPGETVMLLGGGPGCRRQASLQGMVVAAVLRRARRRPGPATSSGGRRASASARIHRSTPRTWSLTADTFAARQNLDLIADRGAPVPVFSTRTPRVGQRPPSAPQYLAPGGASRRP